MFAGPFDRDDHDDDNAKRCELTEESNLGDNPNEVQDKEFEYLRNQREAPSKFPRRKKLGHKSSEDTDDV
ncbi:hypothetical protein Trydic_g12540 [Trypoxylus dichotomus]